MSLSSKSGSSIRGRPSAGKMTARSKVYERQKRQRKFIDSWKLGRPWLKTDNRKIWCSYCSSYYKKVGMVGQRSEAFIRGSNTMKLPAIIKHQNSDLHKRCQAAAVIKGTPKAQRPLVKAFNKDDPDHNAMLKKFTTAFKVAIYNQTYKSFKGELQLLEICGNCPNMTNRFASDKACAEFISYIAKDFNESLAKDIRDGQFFTVLCDGSTDCASLEEEIVYVRYLTVENKPKTSFLCVCDVDAPNAENIFKHLCSNLKERIGIQNFSGLVAFVADGASVNFGVQNGIYRKFLDILPETVGIHCFAHRFELAIRDGGRDCILIDELSDLLQRIFRYYKTSSVQKASLKKSCETHNVKFQSPVNVQGTRWISHRSRALTTMKQMWKPIVVQVSQILAGVGSKRPEIQGKAQKILYDMTNFKLLVALPVLEDIFVILENISLALQESSYIIACAQNRIKSTVKSLKKINVEEKVDQSIRNLDLKNMVYQDQRIRLDRGASIETSSAAVVKNISKFLLNSVSTIEKRFKDILTDEDSVLENAQVFNIKKWPKEDRKKLENYGDNKIENLAKHFETTLQKSGFKASMCLVEWPDFKKSVSEQYESSNLVDFYGLMISLHKETYPNICALLTIILVLPISTADPERGFSLMKRIKTDWRASLTPRSLSNLMTTKLRNIKLEDFNPEAAYSLWLSDGRRILNPMKYKRKKTRKQDQSLSESESETESESDETDTEQQSC